MADLISEVIDLQVFEQVKKLTADLETLYGVMDKTIALGAGNNKIIDPQGMKAATDATNNLNTTVTKLMETESERLNIERQIKAEGDKMAASVKIQSNAIEQAAAKYKMFSNSQKELAQYIMETDRRLAEIKTELKSADVNASNYAQATSNLKIEQAKLKAELSEATKELKRTVTEQKFAEDSMKGMSVRLTQLKDLYSQFTETERNSEFGMTISQGINELDEKLKGLDKSIGDNQRSVGNYEVAGKSLRMQLREIVQELATQKMQMDQTKIAITQQENEVDKLANTLGKNSIEYQEAKANLDSMKLGLQTATAAMSKMEVEGGKIKDAMDDANRSIKGMADDAGNTAAMAQGVGVLADSFSVFQAGMVAVGADGEDLMKVYAKMMIVQQGFNSLTQITNALQAESTLRLKLKAVWDKVSLAFIQKKTVATNINTASTTASAVATEGLAAAETTATATSVGLSAAIKSIPGIGWILGIGAALATLTAILYKVATAQKELTQEEINRQKVAKDLNDITQQTNENTLETITRVKLLQKELNNVTIGSKEYQSIVKEINTLTGSNYDTIKATPKEIAKGTEEWIRQYKIRAKSEAIIQRIVENELEFEKLRSEYLASGTTPERREEIAESLNLTEQERDLMLKMTRVYKGGGNRDKEYKSVINYLDIAKQRMQETNSQLEKQITLEGILTEKKGGTDKVTTEKAVTKEKFDQLKLERLTIELRLTGIQQEEAIRESRINQLKKERALAIEKDPKNEAEITKLYTLEIEKVWKEHKENINRIQAEITQNQENAIEERGELLEIVIDRTYDYIEALEKLAAAEKKANQEENEKANEALKDRIGYTADMVNQFGELGKAIAQNIEDEKRRIKIEQRIAEVQVTISGAVAIANVLIDGGDPYTKAVRIIANLAAITAGIIQAENAIAQANSVSTYADGTDYHKGGAALIGEGIKNNQYQPELLTIGNKSTWITEPTYFPSLPVGASVTPISEFENNKQFDDMRQPARESKIVVDVSGDILPKLIKDGRVIRFANRIVKARG